MTLKEAGQYANPKGYLGDNLRIYGFSFCSNAQVKTQWNFVAYTLADAWILAASSAGIQFPEVSEISLTGSAEIT